MSVSQMNKMLITFFGIRVLFTSNSSHKDKQSTKFIYVEILKQLHQAVHRKRHGLWPNDLILHHDNAPAHKALSAKQFLIEKSITEMEHPPCSPDLAPKDFWLFPKMKSALTGRRYQDTENILKNVMTAL
jgi:histone-lysine N-methyltransferase SETMAR